jgi:hypothetical protein
VWITHHQQESVMTIELSLDQRRALWSNYQKTLDLFGASAQPRLDQLIQALPVSTITEEYRIPLRTSGGERVGLNNRKPWHKAAVPIGITRGYTFHRGGWARWDHDCPCETWLVPNQSPRNEEGRIIRELLYQNAPWLETFGLHVYGLSNFNELYVTTEAPGPNKALYVPLTAFLARDVAAIVERVETYWRSYYVGPRAQEAEDTITGILSATTTARFFAALSGDQHDQL